MNFLGVETALDDLNTNEMRRSFWWLPLTLILTGCATVIFPEQDRLAMGGKYSEIAKESHGKRGEAQEANSADLVDRCIAYSRLKTYDKLFECVGQLERNIAKGERLIQHHGLFSWNYPENISAIPGLLQAEALIDFGDYEKAIATAKVAYGQLPAIEWSSKDKTNSWGRRYRIRLLGMLSMAHALKGDKATAAKLLSELEGVEPSSYEFWMTPGGISTAISKEKRLMLARGNMSLGRYDRILSESPDFWEVFGALSEGLLGYSIYAFVDLPKEFMSSKALYETGKVEAAKAAYDRLLRQTETKSNGDIYWPILFDRGRIAATEGQPGETIAYFQKAVEVIEAQRSTINTEASKIGFVGDKLAVYGELIALLVKQGRGEDAFDYVERSKARSLVDMLASKKDFSSQAQDAEKVRRALETLDAVELASRSQDPAIMKEGRSGQRSLRNVQQRIEQVAPELSSLVTVSSIPLREIQQRMGDDEAVVEYYYWGDSLYGFVLLKNRLNVVDLSADGLAESIQAFRSALQNPNADTWSPHAKAIYQRLWSPLERDTVGKRVLIIPHGVLHYLPFSALQRPDGGFLMDKAALRLLPSASVLKFLKPKVGKKPPQLLAIGNPDLGDAKYDLEFAEEEARLIAGSNPKSQLLLRRDASETNFKKVGGHFTHIHFASHGKFNADAPLNSGLYLAKDGANDGVLTVGELYAMTMDADLVSLSACETGLGKVANGDDVVGLSRGFLYAGSRSIVSSLWSVDDKATGALMKAFYANLNDMLKDEALRRAQYTTRQAYPHPYYWAAFQLTGRAD